VFGEPVHWEKALGSAIIVGGILMLGGDRAGIIEAPGQSIPDCPGHVGSGTGRDTASPER